MVPSHPSLKILFLEYNKLLARMVAWLTDCNHARKQDAAPGDPHPRPARHPRRALRSLVFYLLFYSYTVIMLLVLSVSLRLAPRSIFRWCAQWTSAHRWLVRHVLGIRVEVEGIRSKAPRSMRCATKASSRRSTFPNCSTAPASLPRWN
jgi:hypothetical protein